jgi:WD40 repeat protein
MIGDWNGSYINQTMAFNSIDCTYSQDGNYLAIGGGGNHLNIYNASNNLLIKTIYAGTGNDLYATRLSADSRYLLSAESTTGIVYLYYRSDYYHFNNCS